MRHAFNNLGLIAAKAIARASAASGDQCARDQLPAIAIAARAGKTPP